MQQKQTTGLIWFQNNLRITDNISLVKATKKKDSVIAVYIFDKHIFEKEIYGFPKVGKFRTKFLIQSVNNLKENLAKLNITLLTYFDKSDVIIPKICDEYAVDEIFMQKEWTLEEVTVLDLVKQKIPRVAITQDYNQFLYHPEDIEMSFDDIPKVFTEFRKHLEKKVSIRQVKYPEKKSKENLIKNKTTIPTLHDFGFDAFEQPTFSAFPFSGGETSAIQRLHHYFFETKKLCFYKQTRNGLIGIDYSSKLAAWLANGSISAKNIYWKVREYEKENGSNQSTYWLIFELIWRDFFKYISLKHNNNIFKIGGILEKNYQWNTYQKDINKWINGETSEPFVNANMIEFKKTGFMSNRGRQNVASYFAKELQLDWRIGAAYFESVLLDYDVHSNYGNWMYVAGVGNDPRDRKFNVKLQAERYDPNHKYQNLWLQTTLF